ncbi:unannotated protein [freshwater metagenome]|uniref:Unannotated protein n=1 Tax=freshwater metagenome TaxID=449393 RepID=A0A6J7KLN8_9ZZZZ
MAGAATPRAAAPPAAPSVARGATAGPPSTATWTAAVRDARTYARSRDARVRLALQVDGRAWSFRGHETTRAHSLVKVTVLVAYLRRPVVRGRGLTDRERALLPSMVRRSANAPVDELLAAMGGVGPLRRVARLVGMRDHRPVAPLWATSPISATDGARLFARLPRVLPPRHRAWALGLLRSIAPSQRWGMPRAAPRGWQVAFKSGWNDHGRVVQAMRLDCGAHVVTASVLVDGDDHDASVAIVEGTGRRLLQPLRRRGAATCSSMTPTPGP